VHCPLNTDENSEFFTPVAGLIFETKNRAIFLQLERFFWRNFWSSMPVQLGSENRDRGGIQWNSEPTSPPEPLLKINTIYFSFSGLSNVQKISSGRGGEHCENRSVSTRNDTTSPK